MTDTPETLFVLAGRRNGKTSSMVRRMRADARLVVACATDEQRDALRRQYPDIDPSRFVGPRQETA